MPTITKHVSQGRGKPEKMICCTCRKHIQKGEEYLQTSLKRQRGSLLLRSHTSHGSFKRSQLTESKMSSAYAALEDLQDAIGTASCREDIVDALTTCADAIDEVKDEYQSSLDNMPEGLQQGSTGEGITEKIEQLESAAETIRNAESDLDDEPEAEAEDVDDEDGTAKDDERLTEALDDWKQVAQSALDEVDL